MNAAIDQQCEKWIEANGKWDEVNQNLSKKFSGLTRPSYIDNASPGQLPVGNDGLGLAILGVSGDEVLPKEIYLQIKAETLMQVRGTVQADILRTEHRIRSHQSPELGERN
jgi:methylmalonyl-CoA mutase